MELFDKLPDGKVDFGKITSSWPEYQAWNNMVNSTTCDKDSRYEIYKDHGITVCERWKNAENFLKDMGRRPKGFVLGRFDGTKGFSPENCAWMTRSQNIINLKIATEKFERIKYDKEVERKNQERTVKPAKVYVPDDLAHRYLGKLDYLLDLSVLYTEEEKSIKQKIVALDALISKVNELLKTQDRALGDSSKMFDFLQNI